MLHRKPISRIITLHLIAILFVILNISDVKIAGFSKIMPLFDLMMVFYFAVFKHIFAIWFIFILGIWNDALNGNHLGLTPLCYILMVKLFSFLNDKMIIRENFIQIWKQFVVFCFLFLLMKWLLLSIFNSSLYSVNTIIIQLVLSSALYALMHKFFNYLESKLLNE